MELEFTPGFHVKCNSCGQEGWTPDGSNPDAAVNCACCPEDHDHAGAICSRTVTITATAVLTGSINQT